MSTRDLEGSEARERAVRDAEAEQERIYRAQGSSPEADGSTRRGFGQAAIAVAVALGVVLAIAGAVIGGIFAGAPGLASGILCGLVVGAGVGIVLAAAPEDGRVDRRVVEGREPPIRER